MHKHTIDLLERLLLATEEGRVEWAEVPGKTAFSYLAGDFVILVDSNAERASFCLSDAKGRALEQAGVDDLAAVNLASGSSALSAISSIHAIAKRRAMGTDQAITSVLEHLQGLGGVSGQAPAPDATVEGPQPLDQEAEEGPVQIAIEAETRADESMAADEENTDDPPMTAEFTSAEEVEEISVSKETDENQPIKEKKKRKRSLLHPFGGKR